MSNYIPMYEKIEMIRDAAQNAAEGSLVSVRKELLQALITHNDEAKQLLREMIPVNAHLAVTRTSGNLTLPERIKQFLGDLDV